MPRSTPLPVRHRSCLAKTSGLMCPCWSHVILRAPLQCRGNKTGVEIRKNALGQLFAGIDLRRRNMRHLMIFVCNRWHCVWVVWQNLVLYLHFLVLSDSTHPFSPDSDFPFTSHHHHHLFSCPISRRAWLSIHRHGTI